LHRVSIWLNSPAVPTKSPRSSSSNNWFKDYIMEWGCSDAAPFFWRLFHDFSGYFPNFSAADLWQSPCILIHLLSYCFTLLYN